MNKKGITFSTIGAMLIGIVIFAIFLYGGTSSATDFFKGAMSPLDNFQEARYPSYNEPDFDDVDINRADFVEFMTYVNDNYRRFRDSDNRNCDCGDDCEDYARTIWDNANNAGPVNPILVMSLIMQESNCKVDESTDSSHGIMQINCGVWYNSLGYDSERQCINELVSNPERNIEVGINILGDYYYDGGEDSFEVEFKGCHIQKNYTGWLAAIRSYNGLGCNKDYIEQDFFVPEIVNRYNTLIDEFNNIN